jgi:antitoxin (DNA-binding transcriptional repressor) of toxin-antitoxin stability system
MQTTINIQEAKTHLSRLLASLSASHDIIIANRGVPVARLSAFQEQRTRPLGFVKGRLPESFFDALPEEELREWEL